MVAGQQAGVLVYSAGTIVTVPLIILVLAGWGAWQLGKRAFASNPELKDRAEKVALDSTVKLIDKILK